MRFRERFLEKALGPLFWVAFIGLLLFASQRPKIGGGIFLVVIFWMFGFTGDRPGWNFRNVLIMVGGFAVALALAGVAVLIFDPSSI